MLRQATTRNEPRAKQQNSRYGLPGNFHLPNSKTELTQNKTCKHNLVTLHDKNTPPSWECWFKRRPSLRHTGHLMAVFSKCLQCPYGQQTEGHKPPRSPQASRSSRQGGLALSTWTVFGPILVSRICIYIYIDTYMYIYTYMITKLKIEHWVQKTKY